MAGQEGPTSPPEQVNIAPPQPHMHPDTGAGVAGEAEEDRRSDYEPVVLRGPPAALATDVNTLSVGLALTQTQTLTQMRLI